MSEIKLYDIQFADRKEMDFLVFQYPLTISRLLEHRPVQKCWGDGPWIVKRERERGIDFNRFLQ